jgi:hypothetical protein
MPDSADGPYDLSVRHVADVIPSVAFGHDHVASGTVAMRMRNFLGSDLGNFDRRLFEIAKRFLDGEDRAFHGVAFLARLSATARGRAAYFGVAASVPSVDQSSNAATSAMIDREGKARVAGAGSVLRIRKVTPLG